MECKGKKEMMESYGYTCVVDKMQEKKKRKERNEKGNVWMKERQRIRNHNLNYYHNIFTINFK